MVFVYLFHFGRAAFVFACRAHLNHVCVLNMNLMQFNSSNLSGLYLHQQRIVLVRNDPYQLVVERWLLQLVSIVNYFYKLSTNLSLSDVLRPSSRLWVNWNWRPTSLVCICIGLIGFEFSLNTFEHWTFYFGIHIFFLEHWTNEQW